MGRIAEGRFAPPNADFREAINDSGLAIKTCFDLRDWHDPGADSMHCGLAYSVMAALWRRHAEQAGVLFAIEIGRSRQVHSQC